MLLWLEYYTTNITLLSYQTNVLLSIYKWGFYLISLLCELSFSWLDSAIFFCTLESSYPNHRLLNSLVV